MSQQSLFLVISSLVIAFSSPCFASDSALKTSENFNSSSSHFSSSSSSSSFSSVSTPLPTIEDSRYETLRYVGQKSLRTTEVRKLFKSLSGNSSDRYRITDIIDEYEAEPLPLSPGSQSSSPIDNILDHLNHALKERTPVIIVGEYLFSPPFKCSAQDFLKHNYLVHGTDVLPIKNVKHAGAVQRDRIVGFDQGIRIRPTLHHCIGSLAPTHHMVTFGGMPFTDGLTNSDLVILTPLSAVHPQIYGGLLYDLFLFDQITYDNRSFFIVSKDKVDEFTQKNPSVPLENIFPFNKGKESLPDRVLKELAKLNAWQTRFIKDEDYFPPKRRMYINDQQIRDDTVRTLFKELGWVYIKSDEPYLNNLEELLMHFQRSFQGDDRTILLQEEAQLLRHTIECHWEFLNKQSQNKPYYPSLLTWQEDTSAYLDLYMREYALRAHNKSIFTNNDKLSDFILSRRDLPALDKLEQDLQTLEPTNLIPLEAIDHRLGGGIPKFWRSYDERQAKELDTLAQSLSNKTYRVQVLMNYAIHQLLQVYQRPVYQKNVVDIFKKCASYPQTNERLKSHLYDYFFDQLSKDNEKENATFLNFINYHNLKRTIGNIIGAREWTKNSDPLEFADLLNASPEQRMFFSDSNLYDYYARFIKNDLLKNNVTRYSSARQLATNYTRLANLLQRPIISIQWVDISFDSSSSREKLLLAINIPESALLYNKIRKGHYGSLVDIFKTLGIKEQTFRAHFPQDEIFWGEKRSFVDVYNFLNSKESGIDLNRWGFGSSFLFSSTFNAFIE